MNKAFIGLIVLVAAILLAGLVAGPAPAKHQGPLTLRPAAPDPAVSGAGLRRLARVCPPGTYWNFRLRRCVRRWARRCPPGTYWHARLSRCLRMSPAGPRPRPVCPQGRIWNYRLQRCVVRAFHPCPAGTYRNQRGLCIPLSVRRCPPGYYYHLRLQRCVRRAFRRCPIGQRWSVRYQRCL